MKKEKSGLIVITGASAGLGRAMAREFAKRKARLGLIARNETRLQSAKKEVEALGGQALIFPMDVTDAKMMEQVAETIEKELGPIDIWINNAMVSVFSPVSEMAPEEFKRVTDVTYLGYVYGTLVALKRMRARNQGLILQMGSALAYRAIPLQAAYCAAKHAVQGFTEAVRSELIHDKSRVKISMVQLPALNTTHFQWAKNRLKHKPHPVPPIYQPELIAKTVVWITQHYRREWYLGWMTFVAIVGDKIASSWGDWYLAKHYKDQEYDGLADPEQPDNLFETVPGQDRARGPFDHEATSRSFAIWANRHRKWLFLSGLLVIALFILFTLI